MRLLNQKSDRTVNLYVLLSALLVICSLAYHVGKNICLSRDCRMYKSNCTGPIVLSDIQVIMQNTVIHFCSLPARRLSVEVFLHFIDRSVNHCFIA